MGEVRPAAVVRGAGVSGRSQVEFQSGQRPDPACGGDAAWSDRGGSQSFAAPVRAGLTRCVITRNKVAREWGWVIGVKGIELGLIAVGRSAPKLVHHMLDGGA